MAKQAISPGDLADAWVAGMSSPAAKSKYNKRIQALQVNPMQLAATPEASQKFIDAVTLSVTSGRRAAALNSVPIDRYKTNAVNSSLSTGANKAKSKFLERMQKMSAVYAQASQAAEQVQDPLEKVRASINTMRAAVGKPPI